MRIKGWFLDGKTEISLEALRRIPKTIFDVRLSKIIFVTSDESDKVYGIWIDMGGSTDTYIITEDDVKEILESIEVGDRFYKRGNL